jgi:hypothetical protein
MPSKLSIHISGYPEGSYDIVRDGLARPSRR